MRLLVALIVLLTSVTPNAIGTTIDMTPRPALLLKDGDRFLVQDSWDSLALYDSTGRLLQRFPVGARVEQFDLTNDESFLLIGSGDGSLTLWNAATGEVVWRRTHKQTGMDFIFDVCFSHDGATFVVCGGGDFAPVCQTVSGDEIACPRFPPRLKSIMSAALSADTKTGVMQASGRVFAFDPETSAVTYTGVEGTWPIRCSPDGQYAAFRSSNSGDDESLRIAKLAANPESRDVARFEYIGHIRYRGGAFLTTAVGLENGRHHAMGVQCDPVTGTVTEVWKIAGGNQMERMDFDPATMRGVYTDFRLVTRLVDLRTGGTLLQIDNSANYKEEIVSTSSVFHLSFQLLLGGLVMAVLIVLIIWRRRRLKTARA
jgi:hypothetical protein